MEDITRFRVLVLSKHDDIDAPIIIEVPYSIGTVLTLVYVEREALGLNWKIVEYSENATTGYDYDILHEFKDKMVAVKVFNLLFEDSMTKWED